LSYLHGNEYPGLSTQQRMPADCMSQANSTPVA